ncbi:MAG: hypothetical protein ACLTXL_09675 [Clostridia bacterium]
MRSAFIEQTIEIARQENIEGILAVGAAASLIRNETVSAGRVQAQYGACNPGRALQISALSALL